jgi:hypothetical protein
MDDMININSNVIEGQVFVVDASGAEYTCIGYAQNETFLVFGMAYDSVNNRTTIRTFKLSEVKFKGRLIVPN